MFFCSLCCPKVSVALNMDDRDSMLSSNYENIQKAITGLSMKIDVCLSAQLKDIELNLRKSQDHLSQQLKDIESGFQKPDTATFERQLKTLENISQKANTVTMDTASKIVDEYRDMESRQWNLIIYNAPESESTDSAVRKSEDKNFFDSLIDSIDVGPVDIVNIVRLGARSSGKLQPLRVQFNSMEHRRTNARKLRDSSSNVFKKVYINPDLSRQQRHTQWELRQELARRKEGGETGIFIHRGCIVKQSGPNSHSSTVEMDHQNA